MMGAPGQDLCPGGSQKSTVVQLYLGGSELGSQCAEGTMAQGCIKRTGEG